MWDWLKCWDFCVAKSVSFASSNSCFSRRVKLASVTARWVKLVGCWNLQYEFIWLWVMHLLYYTLNVWLELNPLENHLTFSIVNFWDEKWMFNERSHLEHLPNECSLEIVLIENFVTWNQNFLIKTITKKSKNLKFLRLKFL